MLGDAAFMSPRHRVLVDHGLYSLLEELRVVRPLVQLCAEVRVVKMQETCFDQPLSLQSGTNAAWTCRATWQAHSAWSARSRSLTTGTRL